ncbi:hypothetical protein B0T10DRAFT_549665 [Thelonectria olida]|uniref:Uncharacterized protein n=1 Tax=Thelonectria olida TaxID=1576542 RepID=A0A9P9AP76_9HYPO|nr:hypothetical protein B0T10DRAFT_549665 [Thelonectria olida]
MAEERRISDDWTDVDDVASVHSLSSFDEDLGSRSASPLPAPDHPPLSAPDRPPSSPPSPPHPSPPLYQPQPNSNVSARAPSLTLPIRPASNPFLRSYSPPPGEQVHSKPTSSGHVTHGDGTFQFTSTSTSTTNTISPSISTDKGKDPDVCQHCDDDDDAPSLSKLDEYQEFDKFYRYKLDKNNDEDKHSHDDDAPSLFKPDGYHEFDKNSDEEKYCHDDDAPSLSKLDGYHEFDQNNDEDKHDQDDNSDPNTYLKALRDAIALIEETGEKAFRLGASRISTLSFVKSTCDELHKHTQELKPILATYARRWNDGGVEMEQGDIPLNPSLLEWISHLKAQLLHAQSVMDSIPVPEQTKAGQSTPDLSAKSIPLHVNVSLAGCSESLEDALATIEDFMPIFKTDFDEAQTRRMHIPTAPVGEHNSEPRREAPHPDVASIRRELYSLKDQLRQIMALLSGLPLGMMSSTVLNSQTVLTRFEDITEAISTIVTNHASEWLECGMRSGVTRSTIAYDEFLALDPETLCGITGHISELYQGLLVDDPETLATCTPDMIRNHQAVLLTECGQLQELDFVAELLESLVF